MKFEFQDLFKDIAIYGLGDILLKAISFITLPIYTRIFNPADYGILTSVAIFSSLLIQFLSLGSQSAYARLFFEVKTIKERQLVTSTVLIFLSFWGCSSISLCLPFCDVLSQWLFKSDYYGILFILTLLVAPIQLINDLGSQVLRNQFQAKLFTTLNIISTLLKIGLSLYGVIILKLGLLGFVTANLLAALIMLPIRLWTAKKMLRLRFSFSILKELLAYGIPLVPMSLAYWIFVSSDRIVLGKLSTFNQLGLYSIANSITSILGFVNSALGQAFSPHAVRVYETQPNIAPSFFGRCMTYILVGFGLLCVGMTAFSREVLMLLSTVNFYPAAMAVGPLALGCVAMASTQITAAGISITKKTVYFTIFSWSAAFLNLLLNILFIPQWGMMAASWTTAVSYIFLTLSYALVSYKLWAIDYEKQRVIVVIVLTIAFTLAIPLMPNFGMVFNLLAKSLYCLTYLVLLFVFKSLDKREIKAIQQYVTSS